jgi:integrase
LIAKRLRQSQLTILLHAWHGKLLEVQPYRANSMPRRRGQSFPQMCHHKSSGRAFVVVTEADGKRRQVYLGPWGSEEAKREYDRVIARLAASPNRSPLIANRSTDDITLNELLVAYLRHAEGYYVDATGQPTPTVDRIKVTLRKAVDLFGSEPAIEFGPKALKVVVDAWVKEGISRKVINGRSQTVKRVFAWAVGEELLPSACHERLRVVEGLRIGRTSAKDRPPVKPANPDHVTKALEFMPPPVRALALLQQHCGARAGELVIIRAADIDRTAEVWTYQPETHKGTWRGKGRTIYFGKLCQAVLSEFLAKVSDPTEYLFSPAQWEHERNAKRSAERQTPRFESHMKRNAAKRTAKRKRPPSERYTTTTYRRAIERACEKAGVPNITPHKLRHLAATTIRSELGVDAARAMLGHSLASVTEIYSKEADKKLASEAAKKLG